MTAVWPPTVPSIPDANGGWVREPQDNRVVFQPTVGGPVVRRGGTVRAHRYDARFMPWTDDELAAFEAFFEDDLADGSLHYLWNDPQSGDYFKWRIVGYQVASPGGSMHIFSATLLRLPGLAV